MAAPLRSLDNSLFDNFVLQVALGFSRERQKQHHSSRRALEGVHKGQSMQCEDTNTDKGFEPQQPPPDNAALSRLGLSRVQSAVSRKLRRHSFTFGSAEHNSPWQSSRGLAGTGYIIYRFLLGSFQEFGQKVKTEHSHSYLCFGIEFARRYC